MPLTRMAPRKELIRFNSDSVQIARESTNRQTTLSAYTYLRVANHRKEANDPLLARVAFHTTKDRIRKRKPPKDSNVFKQ